MASRGRPRHPDILTPREWEVLELLRAGASNAQIAERLGITERTAKFHVSEILSKLGVTSREEAATVALPERRRWWAAWPLWARIASAATIAAAAAGLALLAWGVLRTGGLLIGRVAMQQYGRPACPASRRAVSRGAASSRE